jgi:nucleoside-triphosphate--adenylate kinase
MITLYVAPAVLFILYRVLMMPQETFARRLDKYYSATSPLLEFYSNVASESLRTPSQRNSNQHPHQLSFPVQSPHRLNLETVSGSTSDEIWPKLDAVVQSNFPGLKERPESVEERRRQNLAGAIASDGLRAELSQN